MILNLVLVVKLYLGCELSCFMILLSILSLSLLDLIDFILSSIFLFFFFFFHLLLRVFSLLVSL